MEGKEERFTSVLADGLGECSSGVAKWFRPTHRSLNWLQVISPCLVLQPVSELNNPSQTNPPAIPLLNPCPLGHIYILTTGFVIGSGRHYVSMKTDEIAQRAF
jgi:hypothetical protein